MKKPLLDLGRRVQQNYLGKMQFVGKFLRYWGTTTVNGVEVLNERHYYYPSISASSEKVFKLLDMYEDLKNANSQGISSAWIYLNGVKEGVEDITDDIIAGAFNEIDLSYATDNGTLGTIVIAANDSSGIPELTAGLGNQTLLAQQIIDNYNTLWSKYRITSTKDGDGFKDTLLRYSLLHDDTLNVQIKNISTSYTIETKTTGYQTTNTYMQISYTVDLRIEESSFSAVDPIVSTIENDIKTGTSINSRITKEAISNVYHNPTTIDPDDPDYTYSYSISPAPVNPTLWVQDSGGKYWLKASTLRDRTLKLDEKIDLISSILDSGYQKKKVKWYKKVLAVIVFVVVFIVTRNHYMAKGAFQATAIAITTASLAVSLLSMAQMAWGDETGAQASANFNKTIEPIVIIATLVNLYSTIESNINELAAEGLKEAGKDFSAAAIEKLSSNELLGYVYDGVVAKLTTAPSVSMKQMFMALDYTTKMYYENHLEKIKDRINEAETQLADYNEQNENSLYRDLARSFIKMYTSPLQNDWSDYNYDRPYEQVSGPLHIGNIQATTVTALRPSKIGTDIGVSIEEKKDSDRYAKQGKDTIVELESSWLV